MPRMRTGRRRAAVAAGLSLVIGGLLLVAGCSRDHPQLAATPAEPSPHRDVRADVWQNPEFDQAFREVNFRMDGDDNGVAGPNGIPDSIEMALIAHILSTPALDLAGHGGVRSVDVRAAWEQAHASAARDVATHLEQWPHLATLVAGYVLIGTAESREAIDRLSTAYGTPLRSDYSLARGLEKYLGPDGDADGDHFSNREEYAVFGQAEREPYLRAAVDPKIHPDRSVQLPPLAKTRRVIGIVLYEGFEVLDVYGPLEIWGNLPECELLTVAEVAGPVSSAQGVQTVAMYAFDNVPTLDILLVPGGRGTMRELKNETMLQFLRRQHAQTELTISVCTGSALLAKAGLLEGLRATSNKAYFGLATAQSAGVTWLESARWVQDGKVWTSSGVSAGTDMALAVVSHLYGAARAEQLATNLEYQWHSAADVDPFARPPKVESDR